MLANDLNEILEKFDFTDSIVTHVEWSDNKKDLIVSIDYYWDIQEGKDKTRVLKLIFKNCIKVNFQIPKELALNNDEMNTDSYFTIVLLKEKESSSLANDDEKHVEIFTTDYSIPWLSVVCRQVLLTE
ncbi:hypothetical protein [Acetivibrio clariflavus]|uniref:Uncharacterized protein n=1 Tax=Acetivibrio clariflavus (strain DSM 19732 / NBRC 101661 / EBR45) TaxID=720554 RepID=G8M344_ACECE|nr:hypothetical protein [Acetivibrio clariflavus]AEV69353.1 hypothetical protein Clocl_2802 [Acetivibrio clariflavus DSM 19732]